MNSFLIGAATSNSGKTTFTMGLLRALSRKGLSVQPFKCGPDYIDTMFHAVASGRESVNLDTFMSSEEHVCSLFAHYGSDADCQIVEGVMGLFDGYDKSRGSSAEIAHLLDIPVVLVVNAKSVAYSVAPLIYGFKNFDKSIRIAGVVFNMVASESHFAYLKAACEDAGVRCLGYLQRNEEINVPGRHLGLTIKAREELNRLIDIVADEIEKHVDLDALTGEVISKKSVPNNSNREVGLDDNNNTAPASFHSSPLSPFHSFPLSPSTSLKIAVARDEAFNFTYRANIDKLREMGEVTFFSPLNDATLPPCDMLYLPGGYPELFAEALENNVSMRQNITEFIEKGGRTLAECGGFMYLCRDIDGKEMCNVLPFSATMQGARLHLGYRVNDDDNVNDDIDANFRHIICKGHEFHYSSIVNEKEMPDEVIVEQCQKSAKGVAVPTRLYRYKNLIAGYTHWYWAEGNTLDYFMKS